MRLEALLRDYGEKEGSAHNASLTAGVSYFLTNSSTATPVASAKRRRIDSLAGKRAVRQKVNVEKGNGHGMWCLRDYDAMGVMQLASSFRGLLTWLLAAMVCSQSAGQGTRRD